VTRGRGASSPLGGGSRVETEIRSRLGLSFGSRFGSRLDSPPGPLPGSNRRPRSWGFLLVTLLLPVAVSVVRAADLPRVGGVRIEGNRAFGDRALIHWMALRAPRFFVYSDYSSGEFLSDLERLRRFYRGEGFLAVRVEGSAEDGEHVRLLIRIDEGPRWALTECALRLEGPEATPTLHDSLLSRLELSRPGPYRLRTLVTDQERLEQLLGSCGLLDARVRSEASRDDSCHLARLLWSVDTGPRAHYAGMRVYGLDRVRESTVAREVAVRPGGLLRPSDFDLTRRNLLRTGLFPEVEVLPAPQDSGQAEKHLVILVREQPGGSVGAGLGYGTSDRARVLASFEHRNIDGRGLRFSVRGVYGQRRRGGDGEVVIPWFLGRRITLALGGGHERTSSLAWTAELTRGSLHLSRPVGSQTRADLGYRLERQQLLKVRTGSSTPGRTRVGTLSLSLARDTRDDLRRPRWGSYFRFEQDWSVPWLGSLQHFARTDLEQVRHRAWGPFAFSLRSRLGWIAPQSAGGSAPLNERYFAGGLRTIRGFPEDSVGPLDSRGIPAGGRLLVTGTVETRLDLLWKLGAMVLLDAGDLVDHADALTWRRTSVGAGTGLLVDSPIGRLRAYVAVPLTRRFRHGAQLYAATGAAF
jgi:outer membrane protein assembly complex protein YaeT